MENFPLPLLELRFGLIVGPDPKKMLPKFENFTPQQNPLPLSGLKIGTLVGSKAEKIISPN